MSDRDVKALTSEIECPTFETTAFNRLAKPLSDCTVAIVTTASLHHPDQPDFVGGDTTYRELDGSRSDWRLGHWSPNFDASGFAIDHNVVFPIDRLRELAARGVIGRVADRHLSYAGNQFDLATIRLDSGPAGAVQLRNDGVDVVLLTPV
jgi:D-proline reductase (dithiol) PrdB